MCLAKKSWKLVILEQERRNRKKKSLKKKKRHNQNTPFRGVFLYESYF